MASFPPLPQCKYHHPSGQRCGKNAFFCRKRRRFYDGCGRTHSRLYEEAKNRHGDRSSRNFGAKHDFGAPNTVWQFSLFRGGWRDMSHETSQQLEYHYKSGFSKIEILSNRHEYEIDFLDMTQTNLSTNKTREIQRLTPETSAIQSTSVTDERLFPAKHASPSDKNVFPLEETKHNFESQITFSEHTKTVYQKTSSQTPTQNSQNSQPPRNRFIEHKKPKNAFRKNRKFHGHRRAKTAPNLINFEKPSAQSFHDTCDPMDSVTRMQKIRTELRKHKTPEHCSEATKVLFEKFCYGDDPIIYPFQPREFWSCNIGDFVEMCSEAVGCSDAKSDVLTESQEEAKLIFEAIHRQDVEYIREKCETRNISEMLDKFKRGPIHEAASSGDIEIATIILNSYAENDYDVNQVDNFGNHPLITATNNVDPEMYCLVKGYGASIDKFLPDSIFDLADVKRFEIKQNDLGSIAEAFLKGGLDIFGTWFGNIDPEKFRIDWHFYSEYEFEKDLGEGNSSIPKLLVHKRTGEKVVAKVTKDFRFNTKNWLEYRALQGCRGKNLILPAIAIIMNFPDGDFLKPAIVTPYIEGGDLESYLEKRKKPLSLFEFLDLLIKATEPIAQLHNAYVHQDIASRNFFLTANPDENSEFKLILGDMGVARRFGKFASVTTYREIIAYRQQPPEVLLNSQATIKSDIFSLGIMFWKIGHSNRNPFPEIANIDQLREFYNCHDGGKFEVLEEFRSDFPPRLKKLICAMTSINATERPSASEIIESLKMMKESIDLGDFTGSGYQDEREIENERVKTETSSHCGIERNYIDEIYYDEESRPVVMENSY